MELNFNSVETIPVLNASAAFKTDSGKVFKEDVDIVPTIIDKSLSYIPWGADNNMPYHIIDLIESDETLATCQMINAEVCYGSGLQYNTDSCSAGVKQEVEDFLLDNAMPSYFLGVCQDFKHFAFAVSVIILNADGTRIVRLIRKEACYCRLTPAERDGSIRQLLYANWRQPLANREDIEVIDLLDINSPWRDLAIRMGRIAGVLYQSAKVRPDAAQRIGVFYWFASLKEMFARQFKHFFQPLSAQTDGNMFNQGKSQYEIIYHAVNAQIRALTEGDVTKEKEVFAIDTWRALTELDALAKEYEEFNRKYPNK